MQRFKSLTAKFLLISSVMLALVAAFIAATYLFTKRMEGEAKRVNLAGRKGRSC